MRHALTPVKEMVILHKNDIVLIFTAGMLVGASLAWLVEPFLKQLHS